MLSSISITRSNGEFLQVKSVQMLLHYETLSASFAYFLNIHVYYVLLLTQTFGRGSYVYRRSLGLDNVIL